MFTEPVTWHPATTSENDLGDGDETSAATVELEAFVAGRSDERVGSNTPAVVIGLTLYFFRLDIVPGASDRFTVRGEEYRVEGEAHRWADMGVEVALKRTEARP